MEKKWINYIKHFAFAVAMIGAINWGIVGLFNFEIIRYFLGAGSIACKTIYIFTGLCAIFSASYAVIDCQCRCEENETQLNQ